MGKYNDLLIEFMKKKNALVKKHTGLVLTTAQDINELYTWPDYKCRMALSHITYNDVNMDSKLCPWCRVEVYCDTCKYGLRHKICAHENSKYTKIIKRVRNKGIPFIGKIPGMIVEYAKMKTKLTELLKNDKTLYM